MSGPLSKVERRHWARIVAGAGVQSVIDPLLLHEFELAKQGAAFDQHGDVMLPIFAEWAEYLQWRSARRATLVFRSLRQA